MSGTLVRNLRSLQALRGLQPNHGSRLQGQASGRSDFSALRPGRFISVAAAAKDSEPGAASAAAPQPQQPQPRVPKAALQDVVQRLTRSTPQLFETRQVDYDAAGRARLQARVHLPLGQLPTDPTQPPLAQSFSAMASSRRHAEDIAAMDALQALKRAGVLRPSEMEELAEMQQGLSEAAGVEEDIKTAAAMVAAAKEAEEHELQTLMDKPSDDQLQQLQAALGHTFRQPQLLRRAFHVPGALYLLGTDANNDRLALVGDRVLDLVVLEQAMRCLPEGSPQDKLALSQYKESCVSREACTRHANSLGMEPLIVTPSKFRRADGKDGPADSMLAEAFEAVIGAMYLDAGANTAGLEAVRAFWESRFPPDPGLLARARSAAS